jgi:hypothetical protein
MPLHRDIYWIGRQWAVTGDGLQAVNQRIHGGFDIEVSRLWDDGILEALCTQTWFNPEDFVRGLDVARARYPLPPGQAAPAPLKYVVPPKDDATVRAPKVSPPKAAPVPVSPEPKTKSTTKPKSTTAPTPALFGMRIERVPAKFTRLWRIGVKR